MKSYFIIGTDTDCGKTYVTCALTRYLQENHKTVMALKPVASGCEEQQGKLVSDDASKLQACNTNTKSMICPWPLTLPVSPHLAAKADGIELSAREITQFCQDGAWQAYDYLLVEAAGGLMVPLNDQETWIDVLKQSQIPVIVVVGMRLGCINHALLTISVLQMHDISCAGWIANCFQPDMLFLEENIATLSAKIPVPLLAAVREGTLILNNKIPSEKQLC